jgi:hypothetical protein
MRYTFSNHGVEEYAYKMLTRSALLPIRPRLMAISLVMMEAPVKETTPFYFDFILCSNRVVAFTSLRLYDPRHLRETETLFSAGRDSHFLFHPLLH